jgi:thioredoxin reductase (NADPH)
VFIGVRPHARWLADQLALAAGRCPSRPAGPAGFAAGDVRSGSVKRVASAVGEGAMAVRLVHDHLDQVGGPGQ